jgi:hypothetical protein
MLSCFVQKTIDFIGFWKTEFSVQILLRLCCFENLFIKQSLMWNKAMKKLKEEQSEETAVWHSLFIGCKCFTDHVNGRCASWYRHWRSTAPSIWSTI